MSILRNFDYTHDGVTLHGQLSLPKETGRKPAVLVFHHAMGLSAFDCERAQRLAQLGYVALAADMYGSGLRQLTPAEYRSHFSACQEDGPFMRARILSAYHALRTLPEVDPARIGAIGFCFGGQCVLELARSGANAASVVSFHGLLTTRLPAQPQAVKAGILSITGALDPYVPMADVQGFQEEMAAAEADWQMTIYGRGWHSFTNPEPERENIPGTRYDPVLDRLSWAQTTAFLDAALRRAR